MLALLVFDRREPFPIWLITETVKLGMSSKCKPEEEKFPFCVGSIQPSFSEFEASGWICVDLLSQRIKNVHAGYKPVLPAVV